MPNGSFDGCTTARCRHRDGAAPSSAGVQLRIDAAVERLRGYGVGDAEIARALLATAVGLLGPGRSGDGGRPAMPIPQIVGPGGGAAAQ